MAYRIDYAPVKPEKKRNIGRKLRFQVLTAALLLAFILGVKYAWPGGAARLRQALLPGEASRTEVAVQTLVERVARGEPVGEAVTAFCREILENAQKSD